MFSNGNGDQAWMMGKARFYSIVGVVLCRVGSVREAHEYLARTGAGFQVREVQDAGTDKRQDQTCVSEEGGSSDIGWTSMWQGTDQHD